VEAAAAVDGGSGIGKSFCHGHGFGNAVFAMQDRTDHFKAALHTGITDQLPMSAGRVVVDFLTDGNADGLESGKGVLRGDTGDFEFNAKRAIHICNLLFFIGLAACCACVFALVAKGCKSFVADFISFFIFSFASRRTQKKNPHHNSLCGARWEKKSKGCYLGGRCLCRELRSAFMAGRDSTAAFLAGIRMCW